MSALVLIATKSSSTVEIEIGPLRPCSYGMFNWPRAKRGALQYLLVFSTSINSDPIIVFISRHLATSSYLRPLFNSYPIYLCKIFGQRKYNYNYKYYGINRFATRSPIRSRFKRLMSEVRYLTKQFFPPLHFLYKLTKK